MTQRLTWNAYHLSDRDYCNPEAPETAQLAEDDPKALCIGETPWKMRFDPQYSVIRPKSAGGGLEYSDTAGTCVVVSPFKHGLGAISGPRA